MRVSEVRSDWDPTGAEFRSEPLGVLGELRNGCPVAHAVDGYRGGPFWAITRHDHIVEATLDVNHFQNGGLTRFGAARPPLETDPPAHTSFRRMLQPYFSPLRMQRLEDRVRAICAEDRKSVV